MNHHNAFIHVQLNNLPPRQRLVLLGLAHYSGWSAEKISRVFVKKYGKRFTPNDLFLIHRNWWTGQVVTGSSLARLRRVLQSEGFVFTHHTLTLSEQSGGASVSSEHI